MPLPSASWPLESPATAPTPTGTIVPGIDWVLTTSGDLDLTSGDLRFTTGLAAVAQGIRIRLQLFKGEWFMDLEEGVPYFQDLLGHKFSETKARAAFRDSILAAPGVVELVTLNTIFEGSTRTLRVQFEARTDFGLLEDEILVGGG